MYKCYVSVACNYYLLKKYNFSDIKSTSDLFKDDGTYKI